MKLSNTIAILTTIALLIMGAESCYKHEEGCRDINAINYDVAADLDCEENCCKYPKVSLDFRLFADTLSIDTNTYFANSFGDSLRIKLLRMYFSDFSLTEKSGEVHTIYNEVNLAFDTDSIPDYKKVIYTAVKVSEKGGKFDIGTLDKLADYSKVNFTFGIDSLINHSNIDKITTSSYLHQFSDSMYINRDEGYYFMKLNIEIKGKTEKNITIKGDKNIQRFSLDGNIDFTARENHELPVRIDLNKWTNNIDFINKPDDEIIQELLQNLKLALKLQK